MPKLKRVSIGPRKGELIPENESLQIRLHTVPASDIGKNYFLRTFIECANDRFDFHEQVVPCSISGGYISKADPLLVKFEKNKSANLKLIKESPGAYKFIQRGSYWARAEYTYPDPLNTGQWLFDQECRYIDENEIPEELREAHVNRAFHASDVIQCPKCNAWHIKSGLTNKKHKCLEPWQRAVKIQSYHHTKIFSRRSRVSDWTIGFEIEKNELPATTKIPEISYARGHRVEPQPFFAGWETDSSCGVEGISNVFDLRDLEQFREDLEASPYIDVPCDDRCGGHITINHPHLTMAKVRRFAPLLYSLYRSRLTRKYAEYNKNLEQDSENHYAAIRKRKQGRYEYRLISKVDNREQLDWRFRFFQNMADAIEQNLSFTAYLKSCQKLLEESYPEPERRKDINLVAHRFRRWIVDGIQHESILPFTI